MKFTVSKIIDTHENLMLHFRYTQEPYQFKINQFAIAFFVIGENSNVLDQFDVDRS